MDWHKASVVQMAKAIRIGKLTSTELVQYHLKRIKRINPHLNAVVQLTEEKALAQAQKADLARQKGHLLGSLHGVPMTLKDSIKTKGIPTTCGLLKYENEIPTEDATVAQRLKNAGAILLGKTNTPALTLSFETNNRVYGRTKNPYDLSRNPGGSSGGAAAIVSSGGSPFDIGSDTGGSIRQPCHNCGLAGIKPTSGRVPRTGHWISFDGHIEALTQLGAIARYVEDLEYIMPILIGQDGRDPKIIPMPWNDPTTRSVGHLKIAFYTELGDVSSRSDIAKMVEDVAKKCEQEGASISNKEPPEARYANQYFDDLLSIDGYAWAYRIKHQLSGTKKENLRFDSEKNAADATQLIEKWCRFQSKMLQFFSDYDLLLCPTFTHPAMTFEEFQNNSLGAGYGFLNTFNLTGWPVTVVRAGTSTEGLPLGIQIIAHPWKEDVALSVAAWIEKEFGGWRPPQGKWLETN